MLEAIEDDGATTNELMGAVNLGKSRIEAMLKVLDVEGAVARDGHALDARARQRVALRRRPLRARDRAAPARAGGDGRLRRRRSLPDARAAGGARRPRPADCGVCAVCTAPRFDGPLDPVLVREAALHLRSRPLILDVKKMAPDPEGKMRKLGDGRARRGGPRARAAGRRRLGPAGRRRAPRGPLRRRARRGRGRVDPDLAGAGALGRGRAVQAQRRRSSPTSPSASRRRWDCPSTSCSSASATTRRSAR